MGPDRGAGPLGGFLTKPEISQNEKHNHHDSDDVEDVHNWRLLCLTTASGTAFPSRKRGTNESAKYILTRVVGSPGGICPPAALRDNDRARPMRSGSRTSSPASAIPAIRGRRRMRAAETVGPSCTRGVASCIIRAAMRDDGHRTTVDVVFDLLVTAIKPRR